MIISTVPNLALTPFGVAQGVDGAALLGRLTNRLNEQILLNIENDGHKRFALHAAASTPTHLISLAIGDLNGDGRPDLVTGGMHISRPYDRMSRITMWINRFEKKPG